MNEEVKYVLLNFSGEDKDVVSISFVIYGAYAVFISLYCNVCKFHP